MKQMRIQNSQSGFTLIELVVVIVILGILAATALPKFADLQKDARVASLNAAKGSMLAAANLAHAQFIAKGMSKATDTITMEGATATYTNGYPKKSEIFALAGLSSEFEDGTDGVVKVAKAPTPADCKATYTEAAANGQPSVAIVDTGC